MTMLPCDVIQHTRHSRQCLLSHLRLHTKLLKDDELKSLPHPRQDGAHTIVRGIYVYIPTSPHPQNRAYRQLQETHIRAREGTCHTETTAREGAIQEPRTRKERTGDEDGEGVREKDGRDGKCDLLERVSGRSYPSVGKSEWLMKEGRKEGRSDLTR